MKYNTPQILASLDCAVTIQATEKDPYVQPDNQLQPNLITVSAYEADE